MPQLIPDLAALLRHTPNVLAAAPGETDLFAKLTPHLHATEDWLALTFTSPDLLATLPDAPRETAAHLVATEAYRRAVPQLDLVLTPNGFGVVSNANVAPASRERVERLLAALTETRDAAIDRLLSLLPAVAGWTTTEQGATFRATLFPGLSVCDALDIHADRWHAYLARRPRLLHLEAEMAREFLSPELLNALRTNDAEPFATLTKRLRPLLIARLQGVPPKFSVETSLVQFIRETPELHELWSETEVGERWNHPTIFKNEQEKRGYWF